MNKIDFPEGYVLCVDKPYTWTSADVVRKVKNQLKNKLGFKKIKVGHAGTLDPLATGVLLICIGKATKQAQNLQDQGKEYIAEVTFGATTPSYDLETEIDENYPSSHITEELIKESFGKFIGEIDQIPPIFSAKLINGKRAYKYARSGEEVEMRVARITIKELELISYEAPVAKIRVKCGKGTYIRSLARDLGLELQSGGYLSGLERTASGNYTVSSALSMKDIEDLIDMQV